jgi:class 3 adenylate cyclase
MRTISIILPDYASPACNASASGRALAAPPIEGPAMPLAPGQPRWQIGAGYPAAPGRCAMEDLKTLFAVLGGIITLVVVLVGLGRSYLKNQELVDRAKILDENRDLAARLRDAENAHRQEVAALDARLRECTAQREELDEKIGLIGRAGGAVLARKSALDQELQGLMRSFGASGGSIYVPVTGPRGTVQGLAFLCIEPFNRDNARLKSQIIPLRSLAGRCFMSGKSEAVTDVSKRADQFAEANQIANYQPSSTINVALGKGGETIGVLQLLRREGEPPFRAADVHHVITLAEPLTRQVFEVTSDVDSARLLGLATDDFTVEGTVLFFDLSHSALLFQELASPHALLLLNEFFERMCEIAFRRGATLDTYLGDGALLRFNVPRELPDHELAAANAAVEMLAAFPRLRDEHWLAYSPGLAATHIRIGLATGPLLRANLGHSQVQHLTVLGYPISVAAALCDAAPRNRSVILAADETIRPIRGRVEIADGAPTDIGKALRFTEKAHEISGILH